MPDSFRSAVVAGLLIAALLVIGASLLPSHRDKPGATTAPSYLRR